MKGLFAVIASCFVLSAAAQGKDAHKHDDEHRPRYGGVVKEVREVQYELVAKPDVINVYIEDHGKKVDAKGVSAKLTLRKGATRSEVSLVHVSENRLEATGSFDVSLGTTAILVVKRVGQPEDTIRFTLK